MPLNDDTRALIGTRRLGRELDEQRLERMHPLMRHVITYVQPTCSRVTGATPPFLSRLRSPTTRQEISPEPLAPPTSSRPEVATRVSSQLMKYAHEGTGPPHQARAAPAWLEAATPATPRRRRSRLRMEGDAASERA